MVQKIVIAAIFVLLVAAGAGAWAARDFIALQRARPAGAVAAETAPPAANYAAESAWALWPEDPEDGAADIFFIHSTTYFSNRRWNGPVGDPSTDRLLDDVVLPVETAPFRGAGALYAPYYRQATFYAVFSRDRRARFALGLAQEDVDAAFTVFLAQRADPDRPFIIAGHEQGALHALALLQRRIAPDETLRSRLAGAYLIGAPTPTALFESDLAEIPPCARPDQTGCVVAVAPAPPDAAAMQARQRSFALIWSGSGAPQVMAEPDILCAPPSALRRGADGACRDGLYLTAAAGDWGLGGPFDLKRRKSLYAVFPEALSSDALRRAVAAREKLNAAAAALAPIGETVDIEASPVNKVRQ